MPNTKPTASIAINTTPAPKFTISIRSANTMNASAAKSSPDTKPCQGMFHFIDSILWRRSHNWTYLLVSSRWPILWFQNHRYMLQWLHAWLWPPISEDWQRRHNQKPPKSQPLIPAIWPYPECDESASDNFHTASDLSLSFPNPDHAVTVISNLVLHN